MNKDPIMHLRNIDSSSHTFGFGLARDLIAFGKRLKVSEQKLNVLKRCKNLFHFIFTVIKQC